MNPTGRPPARDGIPARKVVLSGEVPAGRFWAARAGDSPFAPGTELTPGTALPRPIPAWTFPPTPPEPAIPFHYQVRYRDEQLVVVDKPHFLPTTGNGRIQRETVQTRLCQEFGDDAVVCHRLDRLTAGLVLCSLDPASRGAYQQLFARREVHKTYLARVDADVGATDWQEVRLRMNKPRGARQVQVGEGTETRTLWRGLGDSVVELRPMTGYTHQLRVVCAELGMPIAGDDTYPVNRGRDLWDFSTPLHLLATTLAFRDPITGQDRKFISERHLPDKLNGLIEEKVR
ncbi:pseudouridine synthase [Corynebacterium uterequi]|uniref:RNA pseudouridylate synthase n=1 Tax=Corynebacterium uterequi TaxID=1072256 RepID=A0A0G3HBP7_9CORY|nr:pseudouridine synthase [Corynebacterium uterequi]AKK10821.1 23S RNA-specific pseudouridylate synthase [Corynebacterium uterequi]